jgi:hypothetical protein
MYRALMPPGYRKEFHIAVRGVANKKLYGFITGIPATIRSYGKYVAQSHRARNRHSAQRLMQRISFLHTQQNTLS